MSAAHVASPRELMLAKMVEAADAETASQRDDVATPIQHSNNATLEKSWRDVDHLDVEFYLALGDAFSTKEYRRGVEALQYEQWRDDEWTH